ncbi:MAG TPA: hypothetical protein VE173_12615, partial [Longimicrobiales bacterium]|nr:hypothetical protein [Longimicrobiales bacterium]
MSGGHRVADVFEGVRRHLLGRWLRAALIWGAVVGLLVLLTAWLLAGADGWSRGTPGPLLLDAGLLLLAGAGVWGLRHLGRRWLWERRVAGSMEKAAGLGGGTVAGTLEMGRAVPPGVSESLAALAERGVARRLDLPRDRLSGPLGADARRWSRRGWRTLAVVGPLVIAAGVLSPGRALSAWLGLGTPLRLLARPVLPALGVEPGDAEVLRGSDVEVRVVAAGRGKVSLHWQAAGDVARTDAAPVSADHARFTLRDIRAPVEYWVGAPDGIRTRTYRITPVDPLFVSDVTVEVSFPPYTGRPPEEYHGDVPPLTAPEGTRIRIGGRASRPLGRARLVGPGGGTALALAVDGPAFEATWRP